MILKNNMILNYCLTFKEKKPEYENETISYAGRLDPMAEGVLVLLIGDENKNRSKY
jgi:tRNA U55 pseudouridine synthase TruB